MSTEGDYDCIVIGAGVQGSFSAYELAKRGRRTLLLEQFVLPHSRGSSHGQTRIIRKAYDQDYYTVMMDESYRLWSQLEEEAGVKLYRQTGLLVMGPENGTYQVIKNTLQRNGVPMVILQPEEFSKHIPHVNLADGDVALVDITAGVLYADRALRAVQGQFQKLGGIITDGQKVTDIRPGDLVTVMTSGGVYRAKNLVVTAGCWTNTLLSYIGLQLPLQVLKINVYYWKEKDPGCYSLQNRFPCFLQIECPEAEHHIYGLPSNEYPGLMKVCYHMGSETKPDERDRQMDKSDGDILKRYLTRCFPGLVPEPAVVESCLYTVTPDEHFVLDCHPVHNNIVIGAGFSGHGFKFGPLIGKLLCELSLGEVPSYDLSPFRIRRFQEHSKSAL
ncbi:Peroxisomal sarcosine oxidase [Merluccius polli]|uniref:Peroxisomal sarcosine oxidase n=1 Tax=Merluccius polli TaxID=89951 RepID=A0AA47M9A1_MERPO|nr:Peroxisomal sarcosine oxidase [Merluccius polli]KAK0155802.1 Peroxisomal sarcosine oxidase [Merluccius polli]